MKSYLSGDCAASAHKKIMGELGKKEKSFSADTSLIAPSSRPQNEKLKLRYQPTPLNIESLEFSSKQNTSNGQRAKRKLKILRMHGFKCCQCQSQEKLTIDHLRYPPKKNRDNPDWYPLDACQVLCVDCHRKKNLRNRKLSTE